MLCLLFLLAFAPEETSDAPENEGPPRIPPDILQSLQAVLPQGMQIKPLNAVAFEKLHPGVPSAAMMVQGAVPIPMAQVVDTNVNQEPIQGETFALPERDEFIYVPPKGWEHYGINVKRKSDDKQPKVDSVDFAPAYQNVRCDDDKLAKGKVGSIVTCKQQCIQDKDCNYFAFWKDRKWCETYNRCTSFSQDRDNIITVYRRLNECEVSYEAYMPKIAEQFAGDSVVAKGSPKKNLHCRCTTKSWMICAVFVKAGTQQEIIVRTRLDPYTQSTEDFEPFVVMASPSNQYRPICYIAPLPIQTAGGVKALAGEIAVITNGKAMCIDLRICTEGTPQHDEWKTPKGIDPIQGEPFRSGDPVYILNEDIPKLSKDTPVPCLKIAGLRAYSMGNDGKGFTDPFYRRKGHVLLARRDYTIYFAFDETDRASNICQDQVEKKKSGKKKKKSKGEERQSQFSAESGQSTSPQPGSSSDPMPSAIWTGSPSAHSPDKNARLSAAAHAELMSIVTDDSPTSERKTPQPISAFSPIELPQPQWRGTPPSPALEPQNYPSSGFSSPQSPPIILEGTVVSGDESKPPSGGKSPPSPRSSPQSPTIILEGTVVSPDESKPPSGGKSSPLPRSSSSREGIITPEQRQRRKYSRARKGIPAEFLSPTDIEGGSSASGPWPTDFPTQAPSTSSQGRKSKAPPELEPVLAYSLLPPSSLENAQSVAEALIDLALTRDTGRVSIFDAQCMGVSQEIMRVLFQGKNVVTIHEIMENLFIKPRESESESEWKVVESRGGPRRSKPADKAEPLKTRSSSKQAASKPAQSFQTASSLLNKESSSDSSPAASDGNEKSPDSPEKLRQDLETLQRLSGMESEWKTVGTRGRTRSSDKPGSSQAGPSSAEEAPTPPQAFAFHAAPPRSSSTDSSRSSNKGKSPQGIVPVTGKPLPIGNIGKKGISRMQRKASIAAASSPGAHQGSRDDSPQSGITFGNAARSGEDVDSPSPPSGPGTGSSREMNRPPGLSLPVAARSLKPPLVLPYGWTVTDYSLKSGASKNADQLPEPSGQKSPMQKKANFVNDDIGPKEVSNLPIEFGKATIASQLDDPKPPSPDNRPQKKAYTAPPAENPDSNKGETSTEQDEIEYSWHSPHSGSRDAPAPAPPAMVDQETMTDPIRWRDLIDMDQEIFSGKPPSDDDRFHDAEEHSEVALSISHSFSLPLSFILITFFIFFICFHNKVAHNQINDQNVYIEFGT